MRKRLLMLLMFMSLVVQAASDLDREQIEQRIQPVGQVHVLAGTTPSRPPEKTPPEAVPERSPGQATYEQYCVVCHRDGLAGAPKFRDKADWGPRQVQKDLAALVASALQGFNAMPPKGTCTECSDEDLKAAIMYMEAP